jgi:uncharacterized cysteine cluster protein YcgN (CxxCxxCC family)
MKPSDWEHLCKRCGECCKLIDGTDCKHLVHLPSGKTACKIYGKKHRIGTVIDIQNGKPYVCGPIEKAINAIPNCAYKPYLHS